MDIHEIKIRAVPILKEAGITQSSLFGSYVRGEAREDSDIDLLVEMPKEASLLDLVRLQRKLEMALGKKVDLLTYNSIHPLLKEYVQKD
ncbi:MAG: nucleotidyltransferase family protein [Parcubacteria group bacterium]|nr:nucleotidyltransferase family protein [Parcubacteria group bacterium]